MKRKLEIWGLFSMNQIPTGQLLESTDNEDHINFIELARAHFMDSRATGTVYDAIMICLPDDTASVFTFK